MQYINGNTPKCRDCRYYEPLPKPLGMYSLDGTCKNERHTGKHRNRPYYVIGCGAACFDAEAPDEFEQITLEG